MALWQANHVARLLRDAADVEAEIVHVSTLGDRDRRDSIASFGGIGIFTREVQKAVLDGRADLAVHSLKDLPTEPAKGLALAAVPSREARFDVLVLPAGLRLPDDISIALAALPERGRIGTGSPRRRSQLLRLRPDLHCEDIRGNVETRLKKLDEGAYDALILAEAGLVRLGLADRISLRLLPPVFLPAVGQGALGIECRSDDSATCQRLALLDDPIARAEATAERSALAELKAGCHAPVGVFSQVDGNRLKLEVAVLSADGREKLGASRVDASDSAAALGRAVAADLLQQGAAPLLAAPAN